MLGREPSSCRKLARALSLDKSTAWEWRHKASRAFLLTDPASLIEPIKAGIAVVRESRKASREWVNHRRDPAAHAEPDRLRWVDYRRRGLLAPDHLPRYRIPVGMSVDRTGRRAAEVLDSLTIDDGPQSSLPSPTASLGSTGNKSATIGTTAVMALGQLARKPGRTGRKPPSGHAQVWRELASFGRFLRPFCNPATRHLPGYVAWFVTRQEIAGVGPEPD